MNLKQTFGCVAAAVLIGGGGGVAVARSGHQADPASQSEPGTGPSTATPSTSLPTRAATPATTPTPEHTRKPTPHPTPEASTAPTSRPSPGHLDQLSEENVVRERLYYDVTGHSFSAVPELADPHEQLGPCTGNRTFADFLPGRGLSQIETILAGSDVTRVTEVLAQTQTAARARSAADRIVSMVQQCPGVQGGDFGYGDPVTTADMNHQVTYFPGYDSDRRYGGYIVFAVGTRVGVISVADEVGPEKVASLAREAAGIADD